MKEDCNENGEKWIDLRGKQKVKYQELVLEGIEEGEINYDVWVLYLVIEWMGIIFYWSKGRGVSLRVDVMS